MNTTWIVMGVVLTVFGGYILTSIILMKFPTLLHRKKKRSFKAVHISHRGGAGENIENTLTAFRHAASVGTELLEVDCHITKDGEVVVSHDNHLKRTAGVDVYITDTLYQELPTLQKSLKVDFHSSHTCIGTNGDLKIPLLRQVFQEFPDMPINIDVKIDNDDLIRKVAELVREFKRESITVWGSRHHSVGQKLYKMNSEVCLFFSLRRVVLTTMLFYTGLLPFIPLKETHYEVIMPSIAFNDANMKVRLSKKVKVLLHVIDFLCMRKSLISHLKARGIQVYLWVLNEESDFEQAFQLGANGVMTDFPTKLDRFLSEHPEARNN